MHFQIKGKEVESLFYDDLCIWMDFIKLYVVCGVH